MLIKLETATEITTITIDDVHVDELSKMIHFLLKDNFIPSETTKIKK